MKNKRMLSRAMALALTLSMLPTTAMAAPLGEGLKNADKDVYDSLVSAVKTVAEKGGYTADIKVDLTGKDVTYTDSKLDGLNTSLVVDALLADLPYHLYWFDKTEGYQFGFEYSPAGNAVTKGTFTFEIASDCVDPYAPTIYNVLSSAVGSAENAQNTADAVVKLAALEGSDYKKLQYCFEYIKKQVSYNKNAADNKDTPYGSPWQMLCVFDENAATNPVCEGYAKAFKYLCDGLGIDCYLVSGTMNGGEHMWNIVTLDGKNYMVDVTNCDESADNGKLTIGQPDLLFLKGYASYDGAKTYKFKGVNNSTITFVYDDKTVNLFQSVGMYDVLNISAQDYVPGADVPGDDTPGADVPGDDTPGTDVPGDDTPGTDVPGDDTPGTDVPDDDTSDVDPTPDGKFPVYNYKELVDALSTNTGDITFTPASDFGWPENGTVTIPASILSLDILADSWEIPEGITLHFESNNTGIYCDEVILRGTISSEYVGIDGILGNCKKVVIDSPEAFRSPDESRLCAQYISEEETWEVKKGAVLNADIYLAGTLTGDGCVTGQIDVYDGYIQGQSMNATISGNLYLKDYVFVGKSAEDQSTLTIPAGSHVVFGSSLILGDGTLYLDGNAEFITSADAQYGSSNLSIDTKSAVVMGEDSHIYFNAPSNILLKIQSQDEDFKLTEDNRDEVPCYIDGNGTISFDTASLEEGKAYYPMGLGLETLNVCAEKPDKLWLPCCYVNFQDISIVYDGVLLPMQPSDEPEIPEVKTYTVKFDSNGGSAINSQTVEENGKVTKPVDPTREGYRFDGWYDITGGKFDFGTSITADTALTAKWTKVHTVTFDFNGLSANKSFVVEDGSYIDGLIADPVREGYEFAGWYLNDEPFDFNLTAITTDTVLTARWMKDGSLVNVYTVSFDTGVYGLNIAPQKVEDGSAAKKPADPVRSGYNFLHWLLDSVKYDFAAPVTESITLTALWEQLAPAPDYDDDGHDYTDMTGGGSGSGSGSTGGSSTATEKNPDGSTTTTIKDNNGTVVENTKYTDGSSVQVKTTKDGTVTTTAKDAKGNQTETVEKADGSKEFTAKQKDGSKATASVDTAGIVTADVDVSKKAVQEAVKTGEAVQLPIPAVTSEKGGKASTVTVDLPKDSGKVNVVIPVAEVTPGTVAVIVFPDGTEKVVIQTKLTEAGLGLTLEGGATLKIVDNSKTFDDVKPTDWFSNATDFVSSRNLFAGTSETEFSPNASMTMEMLFAVAHNFMGKPETTAAGVAGAKPEDWFHTASNWAAEMGLTAGLKMDMLGSNQPISREDTAILLFNLSGKAAGYIPSAEALAKLNAFTDIADMDPANLTALAWAVENGIMNGMGDGSFGFKGNNTRAQTGAVMMNFNNNL